MGSYGRSYKYEFNAQSGDKYTFIGIDACIDPGPKRPFNFYGALDEVILLNFDLSAIEFFSSI
jgi:hypothetical protein